jgi:hypothetical protein
MKIARKLYDVNDPAVVIEVTSFECALHSLPPVCLSYPIILYILFAVFLKETTLNRYLRAVPAE